MINILFEDNHLLVVEKPVNMPSCPDESKDDNLLDVLKAYLVEKYNKPNQAYLGLIHRLDRPVGGVMVFGKTSKSSSRLSQQVREKKFTKKYYAVVSGSPKSEAKLSDKLLKDSKRNIVKVDKQGKLAILSYKLLETVDSLNLLDVEIETGRPHQIRVQLSNQKTPIWGDQKYNKDAVVGQSIALYAYQLSFYHPITKELLTFSCQPKTKPFNQFNQ